MFAPSSYHNNINVSEDCIKGYQLALSWDYPDDWKFSDVKDMVFHVLEENNMPRSTSQFVSECIQSSGTGVLLNQSEIRKADNKHCEIHLTASNVSHYEIFGLIVVSEAKHVELYLDDIYEQTSKGCLVTIKKGRKNALYESAADIVHSGIKKISIKFEPLVNEIWNYPTNTVDERNFKVFSAIKSGDTLKSLSCKVIVGWYFEHLRLPLLKKTTFYFLKKLPTYAFLSLPEKGYMRLQTVIVKVRQVMNTTASAAPTLQTSSLNMDGVRSMIENMGFQVPQGAEKLMTDIQGQQQQQHMLQKTMMSPMGNPLLQLAGIAQQNPFMQQMLSGMMNMNSAPSLTQTQNHSEKNLSQPQNYVNKNKGYIDTPAIFNQNKTETKTKDNLLFPISRENVSSDMKQRRRPKSMPLLDKYDGFGTPNPPDQSVLINALINSEQHKQTAESRAKQTSEKNYEEAQNDFVKTFLTTNVSKFSIEKTSSQSSSQASLHSSDHERPKSVMNIHSPRSHSLPARPRSLSDFPSESEVDFTTLLNNLITEDKTNVDDEKPRNENNSNSSNARWEAYLRSRVRASQRMSSSSGNDENEEGTLGKRVDVSSGNGRTLSPPQKTCQECHNVQMELMAHILASEQRIKDHTTKKLQELSDKISMQFDTINKNLMSLNAAYFDEKYYENNAQKSTV